MTDIIESLRAAYGDNAGICNEAADEIKRLRGLIALCVTRAEAYGSVEFAKVLRSELRTTSKASVGS